MTPTPTTGALFNRSNKASLKNINKPMNKIQSFLGNIGTKTKGVAASIMSGVKNAPRSLTELKQKIRKKPPTSSKITKGGIQDVQGEPTIKNRLKDTVSSAKERSRDLLTKAAPIGESAKATALSGVARMKTFAKKATEPTESNNVKGQNQSSSNTMITNSTSSNNTTTINRYDTDVVSKWRSSYIEDQHKPGHYSM
jgi:hypothetical protein